MNDRPPRLVVVIPTHWRRPLFSRTLATVAEQLAEVTNARGLVIASGVGEARFGELNADAARHGMEAIHVPEPGLTRARNAAVDWAHDAGVEVVACIDDDAVPKPGWLAALAGHWRAAPADVACIGGAIDPLWLEPPPDWMSDRLRVVYSLLDRGPGVLPLRPGIEDAFGANLSFRVDALRAIGGFSQSLGPVGRIPFFGDETDALRRLAAAGWTGLYVGDARVDHAVPPERMRLREVARRRFYGGAGMRILGLWSLGDGAARLLAGAAEALVAIPMRSSRRFAAGLARAGAGAGALAAPLVRMKVRREQSR